MDCLKCRTLLVTKRPEDIKFVKSKLEIIRYHKNQVRDLKLFLHNRSLRINYIQQLLLIG